VIYPPALACYEWGWEIKNISRKTIHLQKISEVVSEGRRSSQKMGWLGV